MVGVITHQSGQIEGRREAGLTLREQIAKALVGVFRGAEAGKLPHRPEPAAMHGGMNAARVGRLAGKAQVAAGIPARKISRCVQTPDRISGNRGELGLPLRTFFERGAESVFFPSAFFYRGLARCGRSVASGDGRGRSLDLITHGFAPQFVRVPVGSPKELTIPCYAKAKSGARGRDAVVSKRKKRGWGGSKSHTASLEKLAWPSVTQALEELFGADDFSVKRAGD